MSAGPRPVEGAVTTLLILFEKSGGERYGLTLQAFEVVLEQVARKYVPEATAQQKLEFWRDLKLEELALARAKGDRGVLDFNGRNEAFNGLTGTGTVTNSAATAYVAATPLAVEVGLEGQGTQGQGVRRHPDGPVAVDCARRTLR